MSAPTEPGLYSGVPEAVYHADRESVSSSQARRLLEVTPFRWNFEREHPRPPSEEMVWGSAVHSLVLGDGPLPVDTGYDRWQSGDAKARVAEIRASGAIALKPKDFARAHAAAERVREHPEAAAVLSAGKPELSAFARDPQTGLMMRARPDWLRLLTPSTALVGDLKTTNKSGPDEWIWSAGEFGYFLQQPWYEDVLALLGIEVVRWLWLIVCSDPPHEVWVQEFPPSAPELGRRCNRRALEVLADALAAGEWPTHRAEIRVDDIPQKFYRREEYL